jgi:GR25 family glycosyltransferase involved in LPS biosynthesis
MFNFKYKDFNKLINQKQNVNIKLLYSKDVNINNIKNVSFKNNIQDKINFNDNYKKVNSFIDSVEFYDNMETQDKNRDEHISNKVSRDEIKINENIINEIDNKLLINYLIDNYKSKEIINNNYLFEHVYIISLKKCINKRERCINQLLKYNISNFEFFDAVDTISGNFYNILYEKIISKYDKDFITYNYQKGALGCLLSHLNVLKDAKEKGYKSILILEDDFLINNKFNEEYSKLVKNIPDDWDYIYFGKKQGKESALPKNMTHIYPSNIININKINDFVYKPNYFTYATHSICIKNTIYDVLIERYNTLCAPVDLIVMSLYEKYNFYTVYNDLFITSYESDIRETNSLKESFLWNWDFSKYFNVNNLQIKNIIIWGIKKINHTHHYIHNMYNNFFKYYFGDINILWVDNDNNNIIDYNNSIFFVSPSHGDYSNLPYNNSSLYIFHLDEFADNIGLNIDTFNSTEKFKQILKNNMGIILLAREKITDIGYFEENIFKNTICLPWFANIKFNDLIKIKNNIEDIYERNKKGEKFCYFGSIWYLNINEINNLITCSINKNKKIVISGRFIHNTKKLIKNLNSDLLTLEPFYDSKKQNLNVEDDSFERLNNIYGISAFFPIQGEEHFDKYISNRLIEVISNGYVGFSNNNIVNKLFKNVFCNSDLDKLILYISDLLNDKEKYCKTLNSQIDEVITNYYSYKIVENLFEFLKKVFLKKNIYFTFEKLTDNKIYTLFFTNKYYKNYEIINDINLLEKANIIKANYIINENSYDIFMLDKLVKRFDYKILIDDNYNYKELLIALCLKYKKKYIIKKPLKIFCLLSHQRTGSTLIIDYIQKTSKTVLALSEIFQNYPTSYDINNKNGVLYNYNLVDFNKDASNCKEYIQQFIDFAHENNYECLIFKYTFDLINKFNIEITQLILDEVKKYNIIYLDRNDFDIYISKKLAEINGTYSNKIYIKNIQMNNDLFNEIHNFSIKKSEFLNNYLSQLNKIKYINYSFIKENDHKSNINQINIFLNSFYDEKYEYLVYNKYYDYYNIFNIKQNKF